MDVSGRDVPAGTFGSDDQMRPTVSGARIAADVETRVIAAGPDRG